MTEPVRLGDHASINLRYIRDAMERATAFTSIPGVGGVVIGSSALVTAALVSRFGAFLPIWIADAIFAAIVAFTFMRRKASRAGVSLTSRAARRFFVSYFAPLFAAAIGTVAALMADDFFPVVPLWLACYGASFVASGAHSIRIVPVMGICFMVASVVALFIPDRNLVMAATFGGLHIIFGTIIARNYGG